MIDIVLEQRLVENLVEMQSTLWDGQQFSNSPEDDPRIFWNAFSFVQLAGYDPGQIS